MRRRNLVANYFLTVALSTLPVVGGAQEGCKALTEVNKLPALAALFDSAALLSNLPAPDANGPREVTLSILTGTTPQVHVMDSVSAELGTTVKERVLTTLKSGARNAIPAFRVRVVLTQPASALIQPSVLCEPKALTQPRPVAITTVTPSGAGASQTRPRQVTPRIKIGVNGEVLQVDLGAGTGYPDGDRSLRQSLEGQRYEPARLDGRPVQVWLRERRVELVR